MSKNYLSILPSSTISRWPVSEPEEPHIRGFRRPQAVITQREEWAARKYSAKFHCDEAVSPAAFRLLFWEDLSPEETLRMLAHIRAGTLAVFGIIPPHLL